MRRASATLAVGRERRRKSRAKRSNLSNAEQSKATHSRSTPEGNATQASKQRRADRAGARVEEERARLVSAVDPLE